MKELDEKKLDLMKAKIYREERKNVLSKAQRDDEMIEQIKKIIVSVDKMQLEDMG